MMRSMLWIALASGLAISLVVAAPGAAAASALPAPAASPDDHERLAALAKRVEMLRHEIPILEQKVQASRAAGQRLAARAAARRLEGMKRALGTTEEAIRELKLRLVRAPQAPQAAPAEPAPRPPAEARRRAEIARRAQAVERAVQARRHGAQALGSRPASPERARGASPGERARPRRDLRRREAAAPGSGARVARLLAERSRLEAALRKNAAELARARGATHLRRPVDGAAPAARAQRLHPAKPAPRPEPAARVHGEILGLRQEVAKLARLTDTLCRELRKAHALSAPGDKPAPKSKAGPKSPPRKKARGAD
ncbi:MAG: hypothetical protein JXQ29_05940 [Planctomycetes bacterium]|nr:hypothetical protein [Planctomycetota bacterium]